MNNKKKKDIKASTKERNKEHELEPYYTQSIGKIKKA